MMKATPIAPFVMTKSDFLLEFQIVTLDAPAHLDGGHELRERDVRRQGGQEIASRFAFAFGPLDEQPFFLAGAIGMRCPSFFQLRQCEAPSWCMCQCMASDVGPSNWLRYMPML